MSAARPPGIEPPRRLARRRKRSDGDRVLPNFINLAGDYRFLRAGYWALIDAELNGVGTTPTPLQAATAQNGAACLLLAARAGIPTVEWKVARKPTDVEPPALLVPVAARTATAYHVRTQRSAATQLRRASQNGTRSVLTARLTGPVRSMKMAVGLTTHENFLLAWNVWRAFGLPLATIWYMEAPPLEGESDPRPLFLGLDPLPLHDLNERELQLIEEVSQRPMSQS